MSQDSSVAIDHGDSSEELAVLDLQHLDQYTLGDEGLQSELLQLFRIQLKDQSEVLMKCQCKDAWASSAHMLKGAARAVGAFQISSAAEKLEAVAFDDEAGKAAMLSRLLAVSNVFEAQVVDHI